MEGLRRKIKGFEKNHADLYILINMALAFLIIASLYVLFVWVRG